MAESAPNPAAQGNVNTNANSQVEAKYEPALFYFRPETGEIIFVPEKEAGEFEAHGFRMTKIIDDFHKANIGVSNAYQAYGEASASRDPAKISAAEQQYKTAVQEQKKCQAAVVEVTPKIDALGKLSPGGSSIVELIPLRKDSATGKSKQYNRKIVHVKSNSMKPGWKAFPLDRERRPSSQRRNVPGSQDVNDNGSENITSVVNGKRKYDTDKLAKQLKEFKPEVKAELWKKEYANGVLDFAKKWNEACKWDRPFIGDKFKDTIDLTAQAQFMRYLAATGVESSWDPKNGKAGLKAEAKAEFAVAEAKFNLAFYVPNRNGWVWQFTSPTSGKTYPLGSIRGKLELVAAGVCGASLVVELSSEIEASALKLVMKGAPAPATPPPVNPAGGPNLAEKKVTVAPVKLEAGAFAGVKADADLAGSLQWLNPESDSKEHEDFVKVAPGLSGMAGAGGNVRFEISYRNGKFVIIMQASLCIGLGARGKMAFETDAKKIMTFITWFFYQLYNANFEYLVFVTKEAFTALQNLQFLVIQSGKQAADFLYDSSRRIADRVHDVLNIMEQSGKRNELAERILNNPAMLRISTPETKGMLLYQLTRHGNADWVDPGNMQEFDVYTNRKKAVLKVLQYVQTTRELNNVFQHMDPNGKKTNGSHELTVKRFLTLGRIDMDDDLDKIKQRLKSAPALGYPVVANNTMAYELYDGEHPMFAMAMPGDLSKVDIGNYA